MITVREDEYKTPIGTVYRATLILDGRSVISYEDTGGSADAIAGLVLGVSKFRQEALDALNKHMKKTEDSK